MLEYFLISFLILAKHPAVFVPGNENKQLFESKIPHSPDFSSILQFKKKTKNPKPAIRVYNKYNFS